MDTKEIKKIFENYTAKVRRLEDFREKNNAILVEHFKLEEEARVGEFFVKEKLDMMIDEKIITENVFLENDLLELRIKPAVKKVQFFLKKLYKTKK